jgi:Siphovirus Gp157
MAQIANRRISRPIKNSLITGSASQFSGDNAMSDGNTLFEIDRELDSLLDQIEEVEETGSASPELLERFQQFCEAESEKIDRIGRFLSLMDNRLKYCRQQAQRFQARARSTDAKIVRTKNMALYFLAARGLKKIEGKEFTLRLQKNSQDSVEITDAGEVPITCRELELHIPGRVWQAVLALLPEDTSKALASCIRDDRPCNDAIKEAASRIEAIPGAQVKRGIHLRVV